MVNYSCTPIIKARANAIKPVYHYGIGYIDPATQQPMIAHNSPLTNGVVVQSVADFYRKRTHISHQCSGKTSAEAAKYANERIGTPFHLTKHNCEHFAFGFIGERQSPQLLYWSGVALSLLALGIFSIIIKRAYEA